MTSKSMRSKQWLVLSRSARHAYQSSFNPAPTAAGASPAAAASTIATDKDTLPKTLRNYAMLVENCSKVTLDGVDRTFPEKQLLGAVKFLARMYHEHHNTSKVYTATPLGEVTAQRV